MFGTIHTRCMAENWSRVGLLITLGMNTMNAKNYQYMTFYYHEVIFDVIFVFMFFHQNDVIDSNYMSHRYYLMVSHRKVTFSISK